MVDHQDGSPGKLDFQNQQTVKQLQATISKLEHELARTKETAKQTQLQHRSTSNAQQIYLLQEKLDGALEERDQAFEESESLKNCMTELERNYDAELRKLGEMNQVCIRWHSYWQYITDIPKCTLLAYTAISSAILKTNNFVTYFLSNCWP